MVYMTYVYKIGNVEVIDDRIEAEDFKSALDRVDRKYAKEKEKKKSIFRKVMNACGIK